MCTKVQYKFILPKKKNLLFWFHSLRKGEFDSKVKSMLHKENYILFFEEIKMKLYYHTKQQISNTRCAKETTKSYKRSVSQKQTQVSQCP